MNNHASGTFDVQLAPLVLEEQASAPEMARLSINKQFHGDLEASSKGQMLSAGTGVEGSAGYVAIEQVNGKLRGRSGTFILQHTGLMNRGAPQLTIIVVPDSGTGELAGLSGQMTIEITDGKHLYDFAYTLSQA